MSGRVSSCLQAGEHCSQACGSEHWKSTSCVQWSLSLCRHRPRAPPFHLSRASRRVRLLRDRPRVWCILAPPPPAGPSSLTQASPRFSPFSHGSAEPLPSPPPGEAGCPPGLHAGRRLAWLSEPLRSPLCWNATLTSPVPWGLSLGAQEPRPGLHRHDRAQRPEEELVWEVCIQFPFYCLQALFYKSTLCTSPPAHYSHKVSPQTLDPSPPRHFLLVQHLH